ncbi:MAG: ABC transporter ATP-binding protein [Maioricimonas sp. JB049]
MITVENLVCTLHRGDTAIPILRGLSCEIAEGAFTFIVGPSGSGKSTLLYLLGALDQPTSGEITIGGQRFSEMTEADRDAFRRLHVGFIFQSFNLLSNLDAVGNVLVPYLPTGQTAERREEAVQLLHRVGLGQRLDHRPGQLSGGEQQRVAIARAILKRPSIVLADEPTGELDTATGEEVFHYLRDLQAENGSTVVVVTHDQRYIRPTDVVLEIRDGRFVGQSPEPVETEQV